jgi:hypothetical protein
MEGKWKKTKGIIKRDKVNLKERGKSKVERHGSKTLNVNKWRKNMFAKNWKYPLCGVRKKSVSQCSI